MCFIKICFIGITTFGNNSAARCIRCYTQSLLPQVESTWRWHCHPLDCWHRAWRDEVKGHTHQPHHHQGDESDAHSQRYVFLLSASEEWNTVFVLLSAHALISIHPLFTSLTLICEKTYISMCWCHLCFWEKSRLSSDVASKDLA